MPEKKIARSYRLHPNVIAKITQLSEESGISDTDVVSIAISEYYGRRHPGQGTRLVPLENGLCELQIDGIRVATVEEKSLVGISEETLQSMMGEGAENGWVMALLSTARNNGKISMNLDKILELEGRSAPSEKDR